MSTRPYFPLLAKVLAWLLLNLVVIALAFLGFMSWQLGLGLDSLLSGAAGDRLRSFGETVHAEVMELPRQDWNEAIKPLAERKEVVAGFLDPERALGFPISIPPNVLERLRTSGPPRRGPPDRRGPLMEGGDGRGPRERPDRGPPPLERNRPDKDRPMSRPVFLVRGTGGDGYWACIELDFPRTPGLPPRPAILLIRSDRMDGSGMFFEVKPWLLGGLGVLGVSLAFWAPFVWKITRYIDRLRIATNQISAGQFQISLPTRGNDELGNLGKAVEKMATRLDHLITGQKRFMGDAAHELCAPLARLRTGIGILEMSMGENQRPRIEQIEEDAQELATLVNEILAFSRAENRPPSLKAVNVHELMGEVIAKEHPGYELDLEVPDNLQISGDHGVLARALGNLLRNVQVHAGADAKARIRAVDRGAFVELTVSDNGPGVPPYEIPRLFEPFYRPDRSRSRETGGSGLGLSIVRTSIEACGGEAHAFVPPEGGFSVTLKLRKPTSPSDSHPSPP